MNNAHPAADRNPDIDNAPPVCCGVVPVLYEGLMSETSIRECMNMLASDGSVASPGFATPEGVVVFHRASREMFKFTLDNNDVHKATT